MSTTPTAPTVKRVGKRAIGVSLAIIAVVVGLFSIAKCSSPQVESLSASATSSATASATTTASATATVTGGGKTQIVPLVTTAPDVPSVVTSGDPATPPSISSGMCPGLVDWPSLVKCVNDNRLQWYIDGVNQRQGSTGFSWSDIESWATASNAQAVEVRAIEVFGDGIPEAEARSRAAALVGTDVAGKLAIVSQPQCFDNTRGLETGQMSDFVYCPPGSRQVRVSLLPVVLKDGAIVAIADTGSGVMVDCDNVWWIPETILVPGQPPQVRPSPSPSPVPPPPAPPVHEQTPNVCTEPTPYGTWPNCKDSPTRDSEPQGNNRPGGGGVAPAPPPVQAPPAVASPAPTQVYVPPPAPAPAPAAPAPGATPLPVRTTPPPPPPPVPTATVVPSGTPTCDPKVCG